ncbi:MAG: glycosyltransferase family 4 protein [Haloferacaceae archaeon]
MHVAVASMRTAQLRETGATVRTRRFVEGLAARGHEVTVLCAQWWGGDHDRFEQDGVTYRRLVSAPASGTFAARLPRALLGLGRAGDGVDVIHVPNSPAAAVATAAAAARLLDAPLIVDWWDDHPADSPAAAARAVRAPDALIVPSEMVATHARERGAPADRIHRIPGSIDMDLVREAPVDRRADVVYARRLDADANVEHFLLALAELRDRDWDAVVVGDGPARAEAAATAADLRIDDRVTFLGDLPLGELVPILKGGHLFAQTATREPFATELLLALACGCVGLVEYQAGSSAHELVENHDRGARVTSAEELGDEIAAAAEAFDHRTVDESFAEYDHDAVLARYVDRCRRLIEGR